MSRRSLVLPAAILAVVATMMSLAQVFAQGKWLMPCLGAVLLAFGLGALARRIDVPGILAPALSLLGLLVLLGLAFHRPTTAYGLPSTATVRAVGAAFGDAVRDVRNQPSPAVPTDPLLQLAVSGVFAVAMLVDAIALRLRRPVGAGLPLLALFIVPAAITSRGNVVAFVLAAAGYLTLLVAESRDRARAWGRKLVGIDAVGELSDVSQVSRVGRRLGAAAVCLAVGVPVLVPSPGKGIFADGFNPFDRGDGSTTVTVYNPIVSIRSQLIDTKRRPLLRIRTNHTNYLRMVTLDVFNGVEWGLGDKQAADARDRVDRDPNVPLPPELAHIGTVDTSYDIQVGSLEVRWLPVPYAPRVVHVSGDWRFKRSNLSILSAHNVSRGVHFSGESSVPFPTPDQLLHSPGFGTDLRPYLDLPADPTPPEVEAVLKLVHKPTPFETAVAIQEYFRSGAFTYSLDPAPGTGESEIVAFLKRKTGYCEQFAAAMAYLARLSNIPARVAVGFTPGALQADGSYVVSTTDAHAWPELYFASAGWVTFEPTPRADGGVTTTPPSYTTLQPPVGSDPQPGQSGSPTPAPSQTPTPRPGRGANEAAEGGDNPAKAAAGAGGGGGLGPWPYLLMVATVALVLPSATGALTRRRRRARAGNHLDRIHVAWQELADLAEDAGLPLRAADSPRAAARRLVSLGSLDEPAASEVLRLATAEERARYARTAPPVDDLLGAVRTARRALLARMTKATRWRTAAFPPSAVRRLREWGSAAVDRVDGAQSRFWRRVGAVLRRRTRTV